MSGWDWMDAAWRDARNAGERAGHGPDCRCRECARAEVYAAGEEER